MEMFLVLLLAAFAEARIYCEETKPPLEVGTWKHYLQHMDSAVVENVPVSIIEGQVYVYENYFPGYTIKYIHVDNLAIKSCGASASIKSGGVDTSSVLIILHAETNQEIRSVIDIWGEKNHQKPTKRPPNHDEKVQSLYLFKGLRAVNHNIRYS